MNSDTSIKTNIQTITHTNVSIHVNANTKIDMSTNMYIDIENKQLHSSIWRYVRVHIYTHVHGHKCIFLSMSNPFAKS